MQTTINDKFKYISIAMDDDCLSEEILDKLLADKEASQKWYEYHLIGDCLRSRKEGMGKDFDFAQSSNFMATLAEISLENKRLYEAGQIKPVKDLPVQASNHAFKCFAIAASVAAVAVSVWQLLPQTEQADVAPVAVEQQRPARAEVVEVSGKPDAKSASAPVVAPVMPSNVEEKPKSQSAVHVESQHVSQQRQQTIVD